MRLPAVADATLFISLKRTAAAINGAQQRSGRPSGRSCSSSIYHARSCVRATPCTDIRLITYVWKNPDSLPFAMPFFRAPAASLYSVPPSPSSRP
jgi:hypothetical protein